MTRAKALIILGLIALLMYLIGFGEPRIVKAEYLHSDLRQLPSEGAVVLDVSNLQSVFESYGIKELPAWLKKLTLANNEMIVIYPNARITGTARFNPGANIVEVADVAANERPGVGVALLRGDIKRGRVKFN